MDPSSPLVNSCPKLKNYSLLIVGFTVWFWSRPITIGWSSFVHVIVKVIVVNYTFVMMVFVLVVVLIEISFSILFV